MAFNQNQFVSPQGQPIPQNVSAPQYSYNSQSPVQQTTLPNTGVPVNAQAQVYPGQVFGIPQGFGNQPPPMIPGRVVNSESDIRANEIPGDGSIGLFPKADQSCIFMKYWDGTRGIATAVYVLQNPQESTEDPSENELAGIKEQLSRIEKKLNKSYFANKAKNTQKEGNK